MNAYSPLAHAARRTITDKAVVVGIHASSSVFLFSLPPGRAGSHPARLFPFSASPRTGRPPLPWFVRGRGVYSDRSAGASPACPWLLGGLFSGSSQIAQMPKTQRAIRGHTGSAGTTHPDAPPKRRLSTVASSTGSHAAWMRHVLCSDRHVSGVSARSSFSRTAQACFPILTSAIAVHSVALIVRRPARLQSLR